MFLISRRLFQFFCSENQTIYALSSGLNTAISIIRISGPNSHSVLSLIKKQSLKKTIIQQPRKLHFSRFFNQNNQIIDEGLVVYFPKQSSYNRQEIFQLHLHGSKAVVHSIFKQLNTLNLRQAYRGQITKRAVLNGKINLHQAQAINDLINSQSQFSRQVSINNILGKNLTFLDKLKQQLVSCLAKSEAYIDFNQDQSDVKETLFDDTKVQVQQNIINKINSLLENYKNLQMLKDGINILILGRPNVGKSTFMNLMSNRQVAIVNEKPGTTRDLIQTSIEVNGFKVNLIDTAGLRETTCQIQSEGIKRAKQKMKQSHIKLVLIDLNQQKTMLDYNKKIIMVQIQQNDQIQNLMEEKNVTFIINKIDLLDQKFNDWQILIQSKNLSNKKPIKLCISASNKEQKQTLVQFINQKLQQNFSVYLNPNQIFFTRQRYFIHLSNCNDLLKMYLKQQRVDFACEYLRRSIKQLQQIFGRVDSEDVLDVVFRDFCIGK